MSLIISLEKDDPETLRPSAMDKRNPWRPLGTYDGGLIQKTKRRTRVEETS